LPEALVEFPWRRDKELYEKAEKTANKRAYENWAIYAFGFQMGVSASKLENELKVPLTEFPFDVVFRGEYPDAILVNENTKEVLNIEFEEVSSLFKEHLKKHDPRKCDLIVCVKHDWDECPIDVYEITSGQLHKAKRKK